MLATAKSETHRCHLEDIAFRRDAAGFDCEGPGLADSGGANAGSGKEQGGEDGADSEVAANLAKLSAEDRAAAEKQRDCPVSGELLGSMGVPIKVTVKERDVWLCCSGCKSKLQADPDKYLAKLK